MKHIFKTVLFAIFFNTVNAQGIKFEVANRFEEIKLKAAKDNKYLFIDAYTTWCNPCKMMEQDVYSQGNVGSFFNDQLISVKVQMDQTKNDSEVVKNWYATAKTLERKFGVNAYPTMLILTPEGDLAGKIVGAVSAEQLISEVKNIIDPTKRLRSLESQFKSGNRTPSLIRAYARAAKMNNRDSLAQYVANGYLDTLNESNLYEEANVQFAADFLQKSTDRGFVLVYKDWDKASKFIANKEFGPGIVAGILYKENIAPYLEAKNGKPDYGLIKRLLSAYGVAGQRTWKDHQADLFYKYELMPFLRTYPKWHDIEVLLDSANLGKAEQAILQGLVARHINGLWFGTAAEISVGATQRLQSKHGSWMQEDAANTLAFALLEMNPSRQQLETALGWSKKVIDGSKDPGYIDTYARLLYQLGMKREALEWEGKAVEAVPHDAELNDAFALMKSGKPIVGKFGTQLYAKDGDMVNFSGDWQLDSLQGNFAGMPASKAAPLEISIEQGEGSVRLDRKFVGAPSSAELLLFDGSPLEVSASDTKVKRTLFWSQDKSILTIFSKYNATPIDREPWEYTREETFTLRGDGKTLLWSRVTSLPGKVDNVKAMYIKQ